MEVVAKAYRQLANLNQGAFTMRVSELIPGSQAYEVMSELRANLGNLVRQGGDTGNIAEKEQARMEAALKGNWLANSDDMAKLFLNSIERMRKVGVAQLETHRLGATGGVDAVREGLESYDPSIDPEAPAPNTTTSGLSDGTDLEKKRRRRDFLKQKYGRS